MGLGTSIYIFIKWCRDAVRGAGPRSELSNESSELDNGEEGSGGKSDSGSCVLQ
jgi:hypothetical protein